MEQELYPLSTKQKKGKIIADKIFEVILKDQEKSVANIHIEVQGDGQDISERMFKTYYIIEVEKQLKNTNFWYRLFFTVVFY